MQAAVPRAPLGCLGLDSGALPRPAAQTSLVARRRKRHQARSRWWLSEPDKVSQATHPLSQSSTIDCTSPDLIVLQHPGDVGQQHDAPPACSSSAPPPPALELLPPDVLSASSQRQQHISFAYHAARPAGAPYPARAWQHDAAQRRGSVRNPGAHLMGMIKQRSSLDSLAALLAQHEETTNMLHASAALVHAAQLTQSAAAACNASPAPLPPTLADILIRMQMRHAHEFGARQVANSLWALARLNLLIEPGSATPQATYSSNSSPPPLPQPSAAALQLVEGLVGRLPDLASSMQAQEVANCWWAFGALAGSSSLPQLPTAAALSALRAACVSRWSEFKPRELSAVLWGVGSAAARGVAGAMDSSTWLAQLLAAHTRVSHDLTAAELASGVWALAQFRKAQGRKEEVAEDGDSGVALETGRGAAQQEEMEKPFGAPRAGAAQGGVVPDAEEGQGEDRSGYASPALAACADAACAELVPSVGELPVQGLVQALTSLPFLPASAARDAVADALLARAEYLASLGALTPRASASILRAASHLRSLSSGSCMMLPGGVDTTTYTLTLLRPFLSPSPHDRDTLDDAVSDGGLDHSETAGEGEKGERACAARDLITAMLAIHTSGASLPDHVPTRLLALGQAIIERGEASPAHLAGLLWAAAQLGWVPPVAFMAAFQKASYRAVPGMSPSHVAAMLWSLGALQLRPGRKWMHDVLMAVWWKRAEFQTGQLLQILWALGKLQYVLTPAMCEKLAGELEHRCPASAPPGHRISVLCALARLPLVPDPVVRWAEEDLVSELLAPSPPSDLRGGPQQRALTMSEVATVCWAAARLARRLPAPGTVPQRKLHLSVSPTTSDADATATRPPTPASPTQISSVAAQPLPESWPAPPSLMHLQGALADTHCSSDSGIQRLQAALSATSPSTSTSSFTQPSLPQPLWQPLRRQAGRLSLAPDQVQTVLTAALRVARRKGNENQGAQPRSSSATDSPAAAVPRVQGRDRDVHQGEALGPAQLSALLFALPALNVRPSRAWVHAVLFSRPEGHPQALSPHALTLTLFALGCMRIRPPPEWMQASLAKILSSAPHLNTGMVSGVLRGLSLLDWSPGAAWLSRFVLAVAPLLGAMQPKQLRSAHQAATDLDPQLAEAWGPNFCHLLPNRPLMHPGPGQGEGPEPHGEPSGRLTGSAEAGTEEEEGAAEGGRVLCHGPLHVPPAHSGVYPGARGVHGASGSYDDEDPDQGLRSVSPGITHALHRPFRRV